MYTLVVDLIHNNNNILKEGTFKEVPKKKNKHLIH